MTRPLKWWLASLWAIADAFHVYLTLAKAGDTAISNASTPSHPLPFLITARYSSERTRTCLPIRSGNATDIEIGQERTLGYRGSK
ncbi:hypothetical protein PMIN01_13254 [Paraphaeosphaeria minitans]|uniref:Secreted protein n=1 Tax=Paraphaeosphaeria minitans TaxID=565426 RepID=A0A9P6KJY2_9PLEO|nr:hypothetical protein PMIN01_13254 [Paraphaeosphaeria minitans]